MFRLGKFKLYLSGIILSFLIIFIILVPVLHFSLSQAFGVCVIYLVFICIFSRTSLFAGLGNYYYATGHIAKATYYLQKAIRLETKRCTAYLNYAILLLKDGQIEDALAHLKKAERHCDSLSTETNILITTSSCYWALGDKERAIGILENVRQYGKQQDSLVLATLGFFYFSMNDLDQAYAVTKEVLEIAPYTAAAWDNLGQIHYSQNDTANAKEAFQKAIEYKKDLVDSLYYLGLISEEENKPDLAQTYFARAKDCEITMFNTVTKEQIEGKCQLYGIGL